MLQEWLQKDSNSIFHTVSWENSKFFNGYDEEVNCFYPNRMDDGTPVAPLPFTKLDAILINGMGSALMPKSLSQLNLKVGADYTKFNLEEFNVEPNKKYLFRVIGANAGLPLEIQIGGHKMKVVASDGNKLKTDNLDNVDSLIVNSGERYDFVIDTTNFDTKQNYFIVVKTLETKKYDFTALSTRNFGVAVLKYNTIKKAICSTACVECSPSAKCKKANCPFAPTIEENNKNYQCISIGDMKSASFDKSDTDMLGLRYSKEEFEEYFFNFHFSGSVSQRSSINGRQFVLPSVPPFFKKNPLDALTDCICPEPTCTCSHKKSIGKNKIIQFNIFNMGTGAGIDGTAHPVHIHGHHFYVVAMGYPKYISGTFGNFMENNKDINCRNNETCINATWADNDWLMGGVSGAQYPSFTNPPRKDTIFIPVGGYAVIRFRSNNIGYWFFHCHIEVHQGEGMSMIIQEGSDEEIAKSVNYQDINTCEKGPYYPSEIIATTPKTTTKRKSSKGLRISPSMIGLLLTISYSIF